MPKPRTIGGYRVTIEQGFFEDGRAEDGAGFRSLEGFPSDYQRDAFRTKHPNAREAWSASIANRFYHETTLMPYDTEKEAERVARQWVKAKNAESDAIHRLLR